MLGNAKVRFKTKSIWHTKVIKLYGNYAIRRVKKLQNGKNLG